MNQETKQNVPSPAISKEELFAKMNASAARMLEALQGAYEAGMKEGITDCEEDQLIELLRRAKNFRENIQKLTGPGSQAGS